MEFAIAYAAGGLVIGPLVALLPNVSATWRGRKLPAARLIAGIVAGAVWPWFLWKIIIGRET